MAIGLTFNGTVLPSYADIRDIKGRDLIADKKLSIQQLILNKTSVVQSAVFQDREITIDLQIFPTSASDARTKARALGEYFNTSDRVTMLFSDESIVWKGICITSDLTEQLITYQRAKVVFNCEPLSEDAANQTKDLNTLFDQDGTEEVAEWEINFTMSAGANTVKIALDTEYILLNTAVLTNDEIKITSADRKLYINTVDQTDKIQQTTVTWFKLPVEDDIKIETTPTTISDDTIVYKRRYL